MYKYVTLFNHDGSLWARWSRDVDAAPPLFFEPLARPPLEHVVMVDAASFRAFASERARFSLEAGRLVIDDEGARQRTRLACRHPEPPLMAGFTRVACIDDAAALHAALLSYYTYAGEIAAYVRVEGGQARVWSTDRVALIRAITPGEGEVSFALRSLDVRALGSLRGALDVFMRDEAPSRVRFALGRSAVEVELAAPRFPNFDALIKCEYPFSCDARELVRALKLVRAGQRDDEARARFALTRELLTITSDLTRTSVELQGDAPFAEASFNPAFAWKLARLIEGSIGLSIEQEQLNLRGARGGVTIDAVLAGLGDKR